MRKILSYVLAGRYKLEHPVEKAFAKISCYHYYFFAWLFLVKIPVFWRALSLLFVTPPIEFSCNTGTAESPVLSSGTCPCDNPVFDSSVFTKTAQSKFGLVCDRAKYIQWVQCILYAGTLVGSFVFGFLSDKIGRLNTFMITILILGVFGVLNSQMSNLYAFMVVRCIEGLGLGGSIVTSFVLCVEFCGAKNREPIVALYHIPINIGHMSLAGVSYLIRDCDLFQLAISMPCFIFLLMFWFTYESPKWLMDKNRVNEAVKIMDKIGKFNKKPYPNIKSEIETYQYVKSGKGEHRLNFFKVFNYGHLTRNFLCMSVNYFSCGAGYYGMSQFIGKMSGNIHRNVAMSGGLLIPGTLVATILLQKLGRRPFLIMTNLLSGICIIACSCLPASLKVVRVLIACFGNCFFFMSFIIVFLYGVELFPTSIRNAVLGVLCILSRFGQIVAPFINSASQFAAGLTFGITAIIAGILCLPLPETKGVELPTTLEDVQKKPSRGSPAQKTASTSGSTAKKKKGDTSGSWFGGPPPKKKKKDGTSDSWFGGTSSPPKKKKAGTSDSWFSGTSSPPKKKKDGTSNSWFGGTSSPKKKKDGTSDSWFGGTSSPPKKKKEGTSDSWFGGTSSPKKKKDGTSDSWFGGTSSPKKKKDGTSDSWFGGTSSPKKKKDGTSDSWFGGTSSPKKKKDGTSDSWFGGTSSPKKKKDGTSDSWFGGTSSPKKKKDGTSDSWFGGTSSPKKKKDGTSDSWFGGTSSPKKKKDGTSDSWFGGTSSPKKKKDGTSDSWFGGTSSPKKKKDGTSGSWFGGTSSPPKKKKGDTSDSWFSGTSSPKKKKDGTSDSWFFGSSSPPKKKKDGTSDSWFGTSSPKKK